MLFRKEFNKVVFSVSYLIFVLVLVLALTSQGVMNYKGEELEPPQPGQNYGVKNKEIPELIMPVALESLYQEFSANSYTTYPIGFYKNVKLNDRKQEEIAQILSELTGIDKMELYSSVNEADGENGVSYVISDSGEMKENEDGSFSISHEEPEESAGEEELNLILLPDISYEEFRNAMKQVDDILGGGSKYEADALIRFGTVPVSYEEAWEEYELVKTVDYMTGGYARLFSDYAGVMVCSIFPVFLAVVLCMKDRSSRMTELIYVRTRSSASLVFLRFLALLCAVMLPVIICSYYSNWSVWSMYPDMKLDYLAPLKYDIAWILPSVMMSTAVGMCLTELTDTPIAIAVQGFWWFLDVNAGYKTLERAYGLFRLAPRHNADISTRFRTVDFMEHMQDFITNRLLMAGLAILLIVITIMLYEGKRRGKSSGIDKIKAIAADVSYRRNQSEA